VLEVQKRISQDKVEASRLTLEAARENKEAKTKAKMLEQYTEWRSYNFWNEGACGMKNYKCAKNFL
jgi:hypothetical protein